MDIQPSLEDVLADYKGAQREVRKKLRKLERAFEKTELYPELTELIELADACREIIKEHRQTNIGLVYSSQDNLVGSETLEKVYMPDELWCIQSPGDIDLAIAFTDWLHEKCDSVAGKGLTQAGKVLSGLRLTLHSPRGVNPKRGLVYFDYRDQEAYRRRTFLRFRTQGSSPEGGDSSHRFAFTAVKLRKANASELGWNWPADTVFATCHSYLPAHFRKAHCKIASEILHAKLTNKKTDNN